MAGGRGVPSPPIHKPLPMGQATIRKTENLPRFPRRGLLRGVSGGLRVGRGVSWSVGL